MTITWQGHIYDAVNSIVVANALVELIIRNETHSTRSDSRGWFTLKDGLWTPGETFVTKVSKPGYRTWQSNSCQNFIVLEPI